MARIVFAQTQLFAYPGLYYLCGALKSAGHTYRLEMNSHIPTLVEGVIRQKPDIVGFPCMTGMHKDALQAAKEIKRLLGCKTIFGGIHPTMSPDIVFESCVDYVCRGEGEQPLVELMNDLDQNGDGRWIKNLSMVREGVVYHNPMRPLIDPLDDLPFPDYSIYQHVSSVAGDTYPQIFMTRGCPFACSYCHNSNQRKLYKGLGRYVRSFSADRILEEVAAALNYFPKASAVVLASDTIGLDMTFLTDLMTRFNQRFKIPYTCLIRPEYIHEELAKLLAATNCHMIAFGIESGSERIRKELLGRKYSNDKIIQAAALLRKHGVHFRTYNIIGFPSESSEEMLSTLELNQRIRTSYPWASIYTPYPETKLADFAIQQGYLDAAFSFDDVPRSFFNGTLLKKVDQNFILNLHAFFQTMVLFPWLTPVLKPLLKLPHNAIFRAIFKVVYGLVCMRSENRTLISFFRLAWANRKLFR
ncbi:MAG: B12-binding domain-containing radical SAM protein [Magnetococcus sp. DMHC-6]